MTSRHGSYSQASAVVYNHPLPEYFLQNAHSQPMSPQYSNQSYTSTSSSSNQGSYMSTTPPQYENYEDRHSAHGYARHNSQVAAYAVDTCISPLDLHPHNPFDSRRNIDSRSRVLPSSDHRYIAEHDASHQRAIPPKSGHRHHDDSSSNNTEKDNSKRVPCVSKGCNATFSRRADVNRHFTSTHEVALIDCDVNNCGRTGENGFARKDHLLEHKRGYHCMDLPKRHVKNSKGRHQS